MNVIPTLQIRPPRRWRLEGISDVWAHRALLFHLAWRDLKSMHVNSGLGSAWIVIQPLAMTAVLTLFLSFLARVPNQTLPNALIVLSGLSVWTYLSVALSRSSSSLVANAYLLKKVYFPRLLFPLVPVFVGVIETALMLVLLALLSLFFGVEPTWRWLLIPFPILLSVLLASGLGISLSAMNVRFRDISAILPITLQLLMYLSPVIYLAELVPSQWRELYLLNPICGPINFMRWAVFNHGEFPLASILSALAFAAVFNITGLLIFRHLEDEFADIV